jgi:hypothetical protein
VDEPGWRLPACAWPERERPDSDLSRRQSCDRSGEEQFCQLPGQGGEQQCWEFGRRQGVYLADQDNGGAGISGREQDLHEVVITGDQYPVLVAGPLQDHQVICARQPYLAHVHSIVASGLQMSADPVGDILTSKNIMLAG